MSGKADVNPVAVYARVSGVKKKDDGDSRQDVHRQIDLLKAHATRVHGAEPAVYADDGKSAFTDDINGRPAFKKLLMDIKRCYVRHVYIEDMTRFSRKLDLGLQWLRQIGDSGCVVTSLKEGEFEVTSAEGWMRSAMMLMFAEWESRIRSDKVKSGMQKAKNLKKHVGRPKKRKGKKYVYLLAD